MSTLYSGGFLPILSVPSRPIRVGRLSERPKNATEEEYEADPVTDERDISIMQTSLNTPTRVKQFVAPPETSVLPRVPLRGLPMHAHVLHPTGPWGAQGPTWSHHFNVEGKREEERIQKEKEKFLQRLMEHDRVHVEKSRRRKLAASTLLEPSVQVWPIQLVPPEAPLQRNNEDDTQCESGILPANTTEGQILLDLADCSDTDAERRDSRERGSLSGISAVLLLTKDPTPYLHDGHNCGTTTGHLSDELKALPPSLPFSHHFTVERRKEGEGTQRLRTKPSVLGKHPSLPSNPINIEGRPQRRPKPPAPAATLADVVRVKGSEALQVHRALTRSMATLMQGSPPPPPCTRSGSPPQGRKGVLPLLPIVLYK